MGAKTQAARTIDRESARLVDLSRRIHANPELGFSEYKASGWVADELERGGFEVRREVAGLPTALLATAGSGPLVLGICCEYDALPDVGHACGHNLIAAAGVATALALAPLADELGVTVKVFGTPAEESGGGKVIMLENGVFDGTHAAMMVHPVPAPTERADARMMANARLEIEYTGRSAQSANWPQLGINAADAQTVAQVGIGVLRQHIPDGDRIHGIVTHGGDAPNIVPGRTTATYILRSETLDGLAELRPRVEACFEAGATATGAAVAIGQPCPSYAEFRNNDLLTSAYQRNAEALGRRFPKEPSPRASSDMANVSQVIPALHASVGIETAGAVNHQKGFTAACRSASAEAALLQSSVAMAWSCVDLALDDARRTRLMQPTR
ncbi:amidohydrolase [Streptomyces sp. NBC_00006]|uniref:amidohydrolase n=1 Tax=unclassified Streptomyces TaxID=2593676 RepID=UPI00224DF05A|nr:MULTISPECIES: amidohydrolase [unclassified Streptomyces]MCX5535827.1 amidohydrolase [Streptomyces sp. NBC_00006]